MFNLLETLGTETQVLSLDMSLHAQTFNRRYSTETYPNRLDGFVSRDASTLPFKDSILPCVVGFGIGNMMSKMAQGVSEAARVLQDGGVFIFTHMFVDKDSEGWRLLSEAIGESESDCGFLGLEEHFRSLMDALDFSNVDVEVVEEIIGDPDRDVESGPIFPYPNEKQRKLLITATK